MPKFSESEREVLMQVGGSLVKLALDMIATSRAKGVDLEALRDKMRSENKRDIFDALGIDNPND